MAQYIDPVTGKVSRRRPPVIPEIAKAYQNDPRTQLAQQAVATGSSTAPVAQGKYGMADGVARVLSGLGGAYMNKKQMDGYRADEDEVRLARQKAGQDALTGLSTQNAGAVATALGAPPPQPVAQAQPMPPAAPAAAPASPPGIPMAPIPQPQEAGPGARRPFSPSAGVGRPTTPLLAPEPEVVPDAPAPVARPKAPDAVGPTRSRMLEAAYRIMAEGNAYESARGQDMYVEGLGDQTKLDENAAERRQRLIDAEYGTDREMFATAASQDRSNTYEERRGARDRNFRAAEAVKGWQFQHDEAALDRQFRAQQGAMDRANSRANAAMAAAGRGGRPLSFTAAEKLSKNAATYDSVENLAATFKPEFVGKIFLGDKAVAINKVLGGNKEMAAWWQDYQSWVGQIRHPLYGASLTANEKAAFDKITVTPSMNAEIAQQNLARQKAIAATGLARLSRSASAAYGMEAVQEAIGRDPTQLSTKAPDFKTTPGGGGATSSRTGDPLVDKYLGSH